MKTEAARTLLIPYLDGELDPRTAGALEAHLANDHGLRRELEQLRELYRAIDDAPELEPDEDMRRAFHGLLRRAKQEPVRFSQRWTSLFAIPGVGWLGAAAACVVVGVLIGWHVASRDDVAREAEHHQTLAEVQELRRDVGLLRSLLYSGSFLDRPAGYRLQAVGLAEELRISDPDIIDALFETLENDPSPNVRMAALDALRHDLGDPATRRRMARALSLQTNPAVQIALISVLVDAGDEGVRGPIEDLLADPMVAPVVKGTAQRGLTTL